MSEKFYAVAFGYKRGIYENWADCQAQPIYKKFDNKNEAEAFIVQRQPVSVTFNVNEDSTTFYAIARGKEAGVFDNYSIVKKHITGFPKPLYKKFSTFNEAKSYFEKFANGVIETKTNKSMTEPKEKDIKKVRVTKSIARKRTYDSTIEEEDNNDNETISEINDNNNNNNNNEIFDDDIKQEESSKIDLPVNDKKISNVATKKTKSD